MLYGGGGGDIFQAHMSSSREAVGLSVELTGALGKRTKYQTEETAQLLLSVTSASDGGGEQGFIQDILLGGGSF